MSGIELSTIWSVLIDALKDAALCYGGAVVAGAAAGGAVGVLGFGAGAVPGALLGAKAGSVAGTWLLGLLGLKSLVEYLGETIPQALAAYEEGFRLAWDAGDKASTARSGMSNAIRIERAAARLADGHAVILVALLAAIVAYLTRGKSDRTTVLAEIRQSPRLGPKVAEWVERHEAVLIRHPALRGKAPAVDAGAGGIVRSTTGGSTGAVPKAKPAAAAPEPAKKPNDPEPAPPPRKTMALANPGCFPVNKLPASKVPEFDRQLAGQQRGLNELTVQQYMDGRAAYEAKKRNRKLAEDARARHSRKLFDAAEKRLLSENVSPLEAARRAQEEATSLMSELAALHDPDMIAGGLDKISGFGDRKVNSQIGALWKKRVNELDRLAKELPEADWATIKMNAALVRC